ncbi:MAG: ABC transporter ATP-binding protein [Promethearchaeota archaeon]|jgi:ABC-2 type transport system ATP-binding protein
MIKISNLSKSFGSFKAVENLDIDIQTGEIYGLIGPNGSGKTTTILVLLDILNPDPGAKITIDGKTIPKRINEVYHKIGFMPQELSLYLDLTIEQNLKFFGNLYKIPKPVIYSHIKEVLELIDLTEYKKRLISKCSGGMQRRCSLAVALLHKPEILILDEPTVGIDPELRIEFWNYFKKISKEKGVTILITTHYLAESINCDRIGLMNKKILISGTPLELMENVRQLKDLKRLPDMEEVFIHYTHQEKKEKELGGI